MLSCYSKWICFRYAYTHTSQNNFYCHVLVPWYFSPGDTVVLTLWRYCCVHGYWLVHVWSVIVLFSHICWFPFQLRTLLGLPLPGGSVGPGRLETRQLNMGQQFLICIHSLLDWESWVRNTICSLSLKLIWARRIHFILVTTWVIRIHLMLITICYKSVSIIPGTYFTWLSLYSSPQRQFLLFFPFYKWGNEA